MLLQAYYTFTSLYTGTSFVAALQYNFCIYIYINHTIKIKMFSDKKSTPPLKYRDD